MQVAVSSEACGRGVLVMMDGQIHGARDVTKVATQVLWAGSMILVCICLRWNRRAPAAFAAPSLPTVWPQVMILHGCVQPL